jgi:hypothetical protein
MLFRAETQEEDEQWWKDRLDRFESVWLTCYMGHDRGISKSAAFQAFMIADQTGLLIQFFENDEQQQQRVDDDEGDEWKTK